jgi:PAS domain S-box-containing protein
MPDRGKEPENTRERRITAEKRFFSSSLDMLCIAGFDGYFKHLNPACSLILGHTIEALLSQPYLSFVHSEDREATARQVEQLISGRRTLIFENRYRCRDGSYKWLSWNAVASSEHRLIYATARDVTQHKELERHRVAQYAVTRALAEASATADAIPNVLKAIGESVNWELGAVWLTDTTQQCLRCAHTWMASGSNVTEFGTVTETMTFQPGIGLPGRVWATQKPASIPDIQKDRNFPRILSAATSGLHSAFAFPIICGPDVAGVVEFFTCHIQSVDDDLLQLMTALGNQIGQYMARTRAELERERLIIDLREALNNVKTLSGLLPICSTCKKVRDGEGYWNLIEDYISIHSEAMITHGICTDCARKLHPDWDEVK